MIKTVLELKAGIDVVSLEEDPEKRIAFWKAWQARVGLEFCDIASYLLAQEERLRVAKKELERARKLLKKAQV